MRLALLVGLASGLGAVARFLLDTAVQARVRSAIPYGTLAVNLSGSLLLGFLTGTAVDSGLPAELIVVLSAGFCSGFTTWSTYIVQFFMLVEGDQRRPAFGYLFGSLAAGLLVAGLGYAAGLGVRIALAG